MQLNQVYLNIRGKVNSLDGVAKLYGKFPQVDLPAFLSVRRVKEAMVNRRSASKKTLPSDPSRDMFNSWKFTARFHSTPSIVEFWESLVNLFTLSF